MEKPDGPEPIKMVRAKKGCRRCRGTGRVGYRDVGSRGNTRSPIACWCVHAAVKDLGWKSFISVPGGGVNADKPDGD